MHTIFRSRAFAAFSASVLTASGLLGAQQLATGKPAGSVHRISESASDTEPASLLAIFVAEDGATLTKAGNAPIGE